MEEMGLDEPGLNRVIRGGYSLLTLKLTLPLAKKFAHGPTRRRYRATGSR